MNRVVPEGKNFTNLSVGELDTISRKLGSNVLTVVRDIDHEANAIAYAWLAFIWARRQDPKVKFEEFSAMQYEELLDVLGVDEEVDEDDVSPSEPAPA